MTNLLRELFNEQTSTKERYIRFHPSSIIQSHFIVYCKEKEGEEEIIGHVHVDSENHEYIATTELGEELCEPTTDFNEISRQFDIHARLRALLKLNSEIHTDKWQQENLTTNKLNQMKNQNIAPSKGKKENRLAFIEYEKPTKEGHLITIVDSYHNTIGRIHRTWNDGSKKFDYTAYDHAGKPLYMTSEKVWEVKNQFIENRSQLLEDAHQRRIEAKQLRSEKENLKPELKKESEKKLEASKIQNEKSVKAKSPEGVSANKGQESFKQEFEDDTLEEGIDEDDFNRREDELDHLRENESDREDRQFER